MPKGKFPKKESQIKEIEDRLKALDWLAQSMNKGPNHDYSLGETFAAVAIYQQRLELEKLWRKLNSLKLKEV